MQSYQVFIDEHLVFVGEKRKSNQQCESTMKLANPSTEEIEALVKWLYSEKLTNWEVELVSDNTDKLWQVFQDGFKLIKAAGGLVKNANGEYLFIFRLGKWDLPKGKMEKGETSEIAAVREVEEECGISNLEIIRKLPSTFHIYFHKEEFVLKETFWFAMDYNANEILIPQTEEAIEEAKWVHPSNFSTVNSTTYASLKQIIQYAQ